jgi:hypothetical protein
MGRWLIPGLLSIGLLAGCSGSSDKKGDAEETASAAPAVSFTATPPQVAAGETTTLSWSATGADTCSAVTGWTGSFGPSGSAISDPIQGATTFSISCQGSGGTTVRNLVVSLQGSSNGSPDIALSADEPVVAKGGSTTLVWSSSGADSCVGEGAWSGTKAASGSESTGPINDVSTFRLTCTNAQGTSVAMTTVEPGGMVTVEWQAPTQNVDGSALTDLSAFKLYYGTQSQQYTGSALIDDPNLTTYSVLVPTGTYFVAMTAQSFSGGESGYSNELTKIVN